MSSKPVRLLGDALFALDASLRVARRTLDQVMGEESSGDAEARLSNWANELSRSWARPALRRGSGALAHQWWRTTREHAESALPEGKNPSRWLMAPFEWSLAAGSLMTQEALRLEPMLELSSEGARETIGLLMGIWADLPTFFSLEYGELLERLEARVVDHPTDRVARRELGRILLACGLFSESADQYEAVARLAANDSELWVKSHFYALLASCRGGDMERARSHGERCLELVPEHLAARHWLWLAAHPDPAAPASPPMERQAEGSPSHGFHVRSGYQPTELELEEVALELGLGKTSGGRGTAIFDATGNGRLDVVMAGAHSSLSLYVAREDGSFEDRSVGSGLDECVYAFSMAAGDFDGDGRSDLFVTGLGFYDGQSKLYRNLGSGKFEDVTHDAGIEDWGPGFTASWVDFDGDGHLDLFVTHMLGDLFDRKVPNRLYRNQGDGTFVDVTGDAGLHTSLPSLGHAWGDFFGDGRQHLFVSNLGRAQLFRNRGDGTFEDVSRRAGIDLPAVGSMAMACDIDGDGWLDIVQTTFSSTSEARHTLLHGQGPKGGSPLRVFRNRRDGTFDEVGRQLGFDGCWGTMSANMGDLGNRGHLDLALGNGDPTLERVEPTVLYQRGPDGRFRDVTFAAGLSPWGKGHGVNFADLGGDGRLCLIVCHGGLYPGDLMRTTVHRPRRLPGHYLNIRLEATRGHAEARGARIRLRSDGRDQYRWLSGGSGFGCLPLEQHFGLGSNAPASGLGPNGSPRDSVRTGDEPHIEEIEIRWPDGREQVFTSTEERPLPIDATIRVTQGQEPTVLRHGSTEGRS